MAKVFENVDWGAVGWAGGIAAGGYVVAAVTAKTVFNINFFLTDQILKLT